MVKVKICGITNIDDALAAVECGADALGFIFAPSPRQVGIDKARKIVDKLPPFICKVGVFVNSDLKKVKQIIACCHLDLVQLHGKEDVDFCAALFPKAIKVFTAKNVPPEQELKQYRVAAYMLDINKGTAIKSSEQMRLWQIARQLGEYGPVILAGGLNPENVSEAIKIARPYAVDVSSGIESSTGKKDHNKMQAFLLAAKAESNYKPVFQHSVGAPSPTPAGGRQSARPMTAKTRGKLPRYNLENECHFITSVTRKRRRIFQDTNNIEILIKTIRFYQERGDLLLLGYVVMPDHLHLMLIPRKGTVSDVMLNIKAYSATTIRQRAKIDSDVWQDSFYDHTVTGRRDFTSKLTYMHDNPLRKGIVDRLESYPYSSYINFYTDRKPVLQVEMEE